MIGFPKHSDSGMRLSRMLKTTGFAIAIAGIVAPSALAEDVLHERYLEIQRQYEKDHPDKKPLMATPTAPTRLFPNALRAEPGLVVSGGMATPIAHLMTLANDGNRNNEAIAAGEALIANSNASRYDLALVFRTLGYAHLDEGDTAKSVECIQKSLDQDALSNNDQYSLMLQLARTQMAIGQPDAGLVTLARVVTETRQDKPEYDGMRGRMNYMKKDYADAAPALQSSIDESEKPEPDEREMLLDSYFKLKQYDQAEKAGEDMLRARPGDKTVINNLAIVYRQAGNADKAMELLDEAHRHGLLTTTDDSGTPYVSYSDMK